jgi:hypothetical protein
VDDKQLAVPRPACGLSPPAFRPPSPALGSPYYIAVTSCFLDELSDGTCPKSPGANELKNPQIAQIFTDSRGRKEARCRRFSSFCRVVFLPKSVLIGVICGQEAIGSSPSGLRTIASGLPSSVPSRGRLGYTFFSPFCGSWGSGFRPPSPCPPCLRGETSSGSVLTPGGTKVYDTHNK